MKSDHMMSVTEVSNHHSLFLEVFIVVEFENHLWNAIMLQIQGKAMIVKKVHPNSWIFVRLGA